VTRIGSFALLHYHLHHARTHTHTHAHAHAHTRTRTRTRAHTHARTRRYAKLVVELNQSSLPPIAELMRNIQALIGNFSLDPNRVLDHILTALSGCAVEGRGRSKQVGHDCVCLDKRKREKNSPPL
jgi:hypothetical protein